MNIETFRYDNRIVRAFALATILWGLVGFSAGLLIASTAGVPGCGHAGSNQGDRPMLFTCLQA